MVATTFSTDTPNLVTNLVREKGVANNWAWWSFLLTGMMTVFFYARLWRRSNVLTDLEFYEIRYSGRASTFVRGFRAVYLGLFFNCVIMASVNLAAAKIANVMLGWPMWQTLLICAVLNVAFAATSGLWGVLVTDFIQFGIAMAGAFAAAYYSLQQPEVGGLVGLFAKLPPQTLHLLPDFNDWGLTLSVLIIPLTVQWWSVWYPGAEPGGGSYIAQRMLASKSENDALAGTLFFNFAHYAIRPGRGSSSRSARCSSSPSSATSPAPFRTWTQADRARHGVPGHAQVPPGRLHGIDDRRHARRVCLHHLDAPQLGDVVPGA
jgi:SSS family solute:Na+ symporter